MFTWVTGPNEPIHVADAVTVAPAFEPILVADGKAHCRIDSDDENEQVSNWIKTATRIVELDTQLALTTQTRTRALDAFPSGRLPITVTGPLTSVTHVKYYDSTATLQTLSSSAYVVDTAGGRIGLADAGDWPSDLRAFQPGIVTYVCGWASQALVPAHLKHAVRLIVGCLCEDREPTKAELASYLALIEHASVLSFA